MRHGGQCILALVLLMVALSGCLSAPPPASEPPWEAEVRAIFAKFAISLAESGFAGVPGAKVLLHPPVNRATTQMRSEAKPKRLVPFFLQQDFVEPLLAAMTSPDAYLAYLEQLKSSHPAAWSLLARRIPCQPETFQPPPLAQPCWHGMTPRKDASTRYAITISCQYETERDGTDRANHILAFQFRLVDLQTAEVLLTFTEKTERAWSRPIF